MSRFKPGDPVTEREFRESFEFQKKKSPKCPEVFRKEYLCSRETLPNLLPIVRWLPKYKVKSDLLGDIIAGMTVAIMHIPHGLAYSQLGGVPPVIGLYMAVFPLFVYVLMGTSRHISLGTFAVLCAMVGGIVAKQAGEEEIDPEEAVKIASSVGFAVGLWQIVLAILRLGSLTIYMSNSLVSGFTTAAAVHVFTYQFKNLLGIKLGRFFGPLKLIYIYIDLFDKIDETNLVTLTISVCFIIFLCVYYYVVKPIMLKKCKKCRVPVPIELIAVALGIVISYYMELDEEYDVKVVASVPTGLPNPQVPRLDLLRDIVIPSFPLAIVALSINISLADIFARKDGYTISSRQEILAYGAANVFGSFFQCMPSAASLSRSVIQYTSGGRSQLASVFSVTLVIVTLLFAGPLFEPVPYCVLSSIVVASLFNLLLQVRDLPRIFRMSLLDGFVWVVTFLAVVLIDIDYGLLVGFIASIASLLILNHKCQFVILGRVSKQGFYLDSDHFSSSKEVPNVVIVKVVGGLNFSNHSTLSEKVMKLVAEAEVNPALAYTGAVVLDLSGTWYLDPTASNGLIQLWKDLTRRDFRMFLANCNVKVFACLERFLFFKEYPEDFVFATVEDAVLFATKFDLIVSSDKS